MWIEFRMIKKASILVCFYFFYCDCEKKEWKNLWKPSVKKKGRKERTKERKRREEKKRRRARAAVETCFCFFLEVKLKKIFCENLKEFQKLNFDFEFQGQIWAEIFWRSENFLWLNLLLQNFSVEIWVCNLVPSVKIVIHLDGFWFKLWRKNLEIFLGQQVNSDHAFWFLFPFEEKNASQIGKNNSPQTIFSLLGDVRFQWKVSIFIVVIFEKLLLLFNWVEIEVFARVDFNHLQKEPKKQPSNFLLPTSLEVVWMFDWGNGLLATNPQSDVHFDFFSKILCIFKTMRKRQLRKTQGKKLCDLVW